jgi:hypothetical protein
MNDLSMHIYAFGKFVLLSESEEVNPVKLEVCGEIVWLIDESIIIITTNVGYNNRHEILKFDSAYKMLMNLIGTLLEIWMREEYTLELNDRKFFYQISIYFDNN